MKKFIKQDNNNINFHVRTKHKENSFETRKKTIKTARNYSQIKFQSKLIQIYHKM